MFKPETIADFPQLPGVYIMKNAAGEVLYVGKANNLRNRVKNYFGNTSDNRFSVQFLVRYVETIDTIVTASEKDAFLLENNLIKKYQPRYNVRLKDDKTYLSLRFRMNHAFPRLETVRVRHSEIWARADDPTDGSPREDRRQKKDPDIYFGPFTSGFSVKETLRFLLKIFPVRTCKDSVFSNRTRPCILFDVGKCCGPCTEPVSREDYLNLVQKVQKFFGGKAEEIKSVLRQRMEELSENMEFEKAAIVRDRLTAMDATLEKHQAESYLGEDRDVIAIASSQGRSLIVLQQYRGGVLIHFRDFYTKNYEQEDREVLYGFIAQQYGGLRSYIPREILVTEEPADCLLLEEWLREQRRGGTFRLHVPQRGKLSALAHTARQNALASLNRRLGGERTREETLEEISERLMLNHTPHTIECLDISNIMGTLAVGSIVRFENGEPDKSGYRLYRIQTVEGSNDFAMIREVMMRRFRPGSERAREFPDLFIVDGGKGQLGMAEEVFKELGVNSVALAGMAKSRLKVREPRRFDLADNLVKETLEPGKKYATRTPKYGYGKEEKIRFRTEERLFLPGRKNPVTFARNSPGLHLLERIRDETHRTAIGYHRKLRQKTNRRSILEEIPGIGQKRKKLLLKHFGSLTNLKLAEETAIAAVDGVGAEAARNIYQFLHGEVQAPAPRVVVEEDVESEMLMEEFESVEDHDAEDEELSDVPEISGEPPA